MLAALIELHVACLHGDRILVEGTGFKWIIPEKLIKIVIGVMKIE